MMRRKTKRSSTARNHDGEINKGYDSDVHDNPEQARAEAILIAAGAVPFPIDRAVRSSDPLATIVRDIRRQRLLDYFAEMIARDLRSQLPHSGEGKTP